ncbi:MAG: hypothetical protein M1821_006722 [Bathelium mastoideum]|nr:MAG: hypothetical protein M1821_006722 [Bathelium mastoideum]
MPIPFGISVGDFIAFIDTTVKVVNALKDSTGSSQEYRDVVRELESLKLALTEVRNVKTDDAQTKAALDSVVLNCQRTVQDFLNKIEKYKLSLGSIARSEKKIKTALRKIQWALYSKEDVREFQMLLYLHTASLNLLVARINHGSAAMAQQEQINALIRIESKVDSARRNTAVMHTLALSTIIRCWKDFQAMLALIIFGNIRIFELIIGYSRIPSQVTFDQPVNFQDAHGRMLPLQMVWVHTWQHFETMLKWKFSDVPGLAKVERGQYILTDVFSKKDVDRSKAISGQCGLCYSRVKPPKVDHDSKDSAPADFDDTAAFDRIPSSSSSIRDAEAEFDSVADFVRVRIFEIAEITNVSDPAVFERDHDATNHNAYHSFDGSRVARIGLALMSLTNNPELSNFIRRELVEPGEEVSGENTTNEDLDPAVYSDIAEEHDRGRPARHIISINNTELNIGTRRESPFLRRLAEASTSGNDLAQEEKSLLPRADISSGESRVNLNDAMNNTIVKPERVESPRESRRRLLSTELTAALRKNLLWERRDKRKPGQGW